MRPERGNNEKAIAACAQILLSGCGGAGITSTTPVEQTTTSAQTTGTQGSATAAASATTLAEGAAGAILAACAAGFTEFLVMIEPVVTDFDPAAILGPFYELDDAVGDKANEALLANDSRAPYSCSDVGLEWAYFDARSPWEAIFEIAQNQAPGTVAYLEAVKEISAFDGSQVSDFEAETCDDAVGRIKQNVADQVAAGNEGLENMSIDEGLALLGLYRAYSSAVGEGSCPPDVLGNDEWGFMGAHG